MLIIARLIVISFIVGEAAPQLYSIAQGTPDYLLKQSDDSFYYIGVAQHIVGNGISSFDGITRTNGYHPLWLTIVTAITFLTGGTGSAFFLALILLASVLAYLVFELFLLLGKELFHSSWITLPACIFVFIFTAAIMYSQMETTIAVPLYLYLLYNLARLGAMQDLHPKKVLLLGFLSSLLVLSRLDMAIFVGLLLLGWFLYRHGSILRKIRNVFLFCVGGALLPVYLIWNLFVFGNIFPVSMQAKELKAISGSDMNFFKGMVHSGHFYSGLFWICVPLSLIILLWHRKQFGANEGAKKQLQWFLILLTFVFPLLFYALVNYASDWIIFPWYLYALPMALFGAFMIIERYIITPRLSPTLQKVGQIGLFSAICIYVVARGVYYSSFDPARGKVIGGRAIYYHAEKVREFSDKHPGVYAMGNCAGLTAFIIQKPVIQLEGLAADTRMITHIKNQDSLNNVLAEYGVDYLITSTEGAIPQKNDCYIDTEPGHDEAGSHSCAMTGTFCTKPLIDVFTKDNNYHTYIFPVSKQAIAQIGHESW